MTGDVLLCADQDHTVLIRGLRAVLVENARDEVRKAALRPLRPEVHLDRLYLARGAVLRTKGNYAAGVLEGLTHFLPETLDWLKDARLRKTP